jgi:hypothetical protein
MFDCAGKSGSTWVDLQTLGKGESVWRDKVASFLQQVNIYVRKKFYGT